MKYDTCRSKYLETIMKEFESKKLKLRNDKKVTDRKQAIAIALSMAQKKCKYTDKELTDVEKKVMKFLKQDTRKIAEKRIPLTNVIETRVLIQNFNKMGKKSKAHNMYMLLVKRIITAGKKGIKVDKNIFEELDKASKLI